MGPFTEGWAGSTCN